LEVQVAGVGAVEEGGQRDEDEERQEDVAKDAHGDNVAEEWTRGNV
jgi:hypothetical protein